MRKYREEKYWKKQMKEIKNQRTDVLFKNKEWSVKI